jgi:hypothetical protein
LPFLATEPFSFGFPALHIQLNRTAWSDWQNRWRQEIDDQKKVSLEQSLQSEWYHSNVALHHSVAFRQQGRTACLSFVGYVLHQVAK